MAGVALAVHSQATHLFHQGGPVEVEKGGGLGLDAVGDVQCLVDHFHFDPVDGLYHVEAVCRDPDKGSHH